MNIYSLLAKAAVQFENNIFICEQDSDKLNHVLSYGQFYNKVLERIQKLKAINLTSKDIVMICELDPVKVLITMFAAWHFRSQVLIINPMLKKETILHLFQQVSPAVFLYQGKSSFYKSRKQKESESEVAIIVFTSGTKHSPKGIEHGHTNLLENAKGIAQYITLHDQDRVLVLKSLHHISAITTQVILTLMSGASLYFYRELFNPAKILKFVNQERITYIDVVVTQMRYLLVASKKMEPNQSLRYICINGEHSYNNDLVKFKEQFPSSKIVYSYGLSEAGPRVTMMHDEEMLIKLGSVGRPIENVELKIDGSGIDARNGSVGEILVRSKGTMLGYWNNEELTKKTVVDGWLHTSDIGSLDDEGYLYIHGRKDDMIVRGGQNIFPQEIEDVLLSIEGVKECLVIGQDDTINGQSIIAFIVAETDYELKTTCVMQKLREIIPTYMIPNEIILKDQILTNQSGKKNRNSI